MVPTASGNWDTGKKRCASTESTTIAQYVSTLTQSGYDKCTLLQYRGPDAMHTISGESKAIFQMLAGGPYTNSNGPAKVIQTYEASNNKRWADWKPSRAQVIPKLPKPIWHIYSAP